MALLNVALPKGPSFAHFGFSDKGSSVLAGQAKVPSHRNAGKGSSLTIRCLKGHLSPPPLLDNVLNGIVPDTFKKPDVVKRRDFPRDFKFAVSTSALQTEGDGTEGGRGKSTWDPFIQDGVGERDKAVDSYHRYKEDVQLLKKMGVDFYRLSIAWPRILPTGTISGGINQEGTDFYKNFIDELLKNGKNMFGTNQHFKLLSPELNKYLHASITPFVTLFHFDLPQRLQNEYYGFLNRRIVEKLEYNQRATGFGQYGYKVGSPNPNPKPATDPYLAAHHIILSHVAAVQVYKEKYQATQGGQIGVSLALQWFEPYSDSPQDKEAAERALDFCVGWYMDPFVYGDYPFIMKALVREGLPEFTEEEKKTVKGSYDYIGVNYYTSRYAKSVDINLDEKPVTYDQYQYADPKVDRDGKPIGEKAPGSDAIYVYPEGLSNLLVHLKEDYKNPKIYVTENGYPENRDDTVPVQKALQDDGRIQHILSHLYAVREATRKGVDVKGYIMWALMDCMEMGSGYKVRFGLNYVDYINDLKRYPKKSATWLRSFLD